MPGEGESREGLPRGGSGAQRAGALDRRASARLCLLLLRGPDQLTPRCASVECRLFGAEGTGSLRLKRNLGAAPHCLGGLTQGPRPE